MRWNCKQTNDTLLEILSRLIKWIKTNSLSAVMVFLPPFFFSSFDRTPFPHQVLLEHWQGLPPEPLGRLVNSVRRVRVGKTPAVPVGDDSRACSSRIFTLEWCDNLELGVAMMVLLFPKTMWFFALPISTVRSPIKDWWAPGSPPGAAAVLSL